MATENGLYNTTSATQVYFFKQITQNFDVLLTVHLGIILVIDEINAQIFVS